MYKCYNSGKLIIYILLLSSSLQGCDHRVKTLEKFIEVATDNAQKAKDKDIVLVLGNTKAGKSTVINYLLGSALKETENEAGEPIAMPKDPQNEWAKMGHGTSSQTFLPAVYASDSSPFVYCDCPGFNDTRTKEGKFNTTIATQLIANTARRIGGVMVVIDAAEITSKGNDIKSLSTTLSQLFKQPIVTNSFLFLFNNRYGNKINIPSKLAFFEKDETEKLETLAKMQAEGKDVRGEYEDSARILSMLKMIRNNDQNTFSVNLFDEFRSKTKIENMLMSLQETPKACFDFSTYDTTRAEFNQYISQIVTDLRDKTKMLLQASEHIALNDEKLASCAERIEFYTTQIELLDPAQKMKNEDQISFLEQQIKEYKQKIKDLKQKQVDLLNEISNLEKERFALDTDEEIIVDSVASQNYYPTGGFSYDTSSYDLIATRPFKNPESYFYSELYYPYRATRVELIYNKEHNIMDPEVCAWKKHIFSIIQEHMDYYPNCLYEPFKGSIEKCKVIFKPNLETNPADSRHLQYYTNYAYMQFVEKINPILVIYDKKKCHYSYEIDKFDRKIKNKKEKIQSITKEISELKSRRKVEKKLLTGCRKEVEEQRKQIINWKTYLEATLARVKRERTSIELNNKRQQDLKQEANSYVVERNQLITGINALITSGIVEGGKLTDIEDFKQYNKHYSELIKQGPAYFLTLPNKTVPTNLICIIRGDTFIDPVRIECGHTFSQKDILMWLSKNKTCPTCRESITKTEFKPNLETQGMIEEFDKNKIYF